MFLIFFGLAFGLRARARDNFILKIFFATGIARLKG
jgi:hypothetical protein